MSLALWMTTALLVAPQPPQPLVSGLDRPQAVTVAVNKKIYVSVSGAVVVLDNGKAVPFATGLGDPRGLASFLKWVFVADKDRVWRIDFGGQKEILASADAFPQPPKSLTGLTFDPETRLVYVADAGDGKGEGAAIYRINLKGTVSVVTDAARWKGLHTPTALAMDGTQIEIVDIEDGVARLRLGGVCGSCPGSIMAVVSGIEAELRKHVPEIAYIEAVP